MKEIMQLVTESLKASVEITLIIFILMVIIELLVLKYKGKIMSLMTKNRIFGYIISSFFGIIPGCIGTFAMDTLYMSGLLGFGGIIAAMIATSGDETFIMLSMIMTGKLNVMPILMLILILFVLGIIGAFIADFLLKKFNISFCRKCKIIIHKEEESKLGHFIKEHIYDHILKKHLWQIFLWLFAAIFLIDLTSGFMNTEGLFTGANLFYILLIASLIGILPISGPNVFLIVLFSKGMIPFSILLANSIIQDGHGLLPIMGFSMDDAIKIKVFNFVFGLLIGLILLSIGL